MSTRFAPLAAALAALGIIAAPAQAAGTVEVSFVQPERYADAGFGSVERERNLDLLKAHFVALGQRLADGQALKIEVLDVDLAGNTNRLRRHPEVRVLEGRADWPRMTLRWTLAADGRTLRGGQDRLADMAYLSHGHDPLQGEALAHERRMIDEWFTRSVLTPAH